MGRSSNDPTSAQPNGRLQAARTWPLDKSTAPAAQERQNAFQKLRTLLSRKTLAPPAVSEDHILSILAVRRGREAAFGRDLFSDPAWDLLLELQAAKISGRTVELTDLARSLDIPASTIARWIRVLADRELVVCCPSPPSLVGNGNIEVKLSAKGTCAMKHLLDYWGSAFRSI